MARTASTMSGVSLAANVELSFVERDVRATLRSSSRSISLGSLNESRNWKAVSILSESIIALHVQTSVQCAWSCGGGFARQGSGVAKSWGPLLGQDARYQAPNCGENMKRKQTELQLLRTRGWTDIMHLDLCMVLLGSGSVWDKVLRTLGPFLGGPLVCG